MIAENQPSKLAALKAYAPGLNRRRRKNGVVAYYWVPTRKDIADGFRPRVIRLIPQPEGIIAAECRRLWSDLLQWRDGLRPPTHSRVDGLLVDYCAASGAKARDVIRDALTAYIADQLNESAAIRAKFEEAQARREERPSRRSPKP